MKWTSVKVTEVDSVYATARFKVPQESSIAAAGLEHNHHSSSYVRLELKDSLLVPDDDDDGKEMNSRIMFDQNLIKAQASLAASAEYSVFNGKVPGPR